MQTQKTTTTKLTDRELMNLRRCERLIKRLTEPEIATHIGQFKTLLFITLHDAWANKGNSMINDEMLGIMYDLHDLISEVESIEWEKIRFSLREEL